MSEGEDWTNVSNMIIITIVHSWMEMGGSYNIFHHQVSKNHKEAWFHHCSGEQSYKGCIFCSKKTTHKATNIAEINMKEIDRIHGVPKVIVSNRDIKFTSNFWKGLFKIFETNLNFGTTYHPKLDG